MKRCDYKGTPPFADAEWANRPNAPCLWCAGSGHPHGDESYGICECPTAPPDYPALTLKHRIALGAHRGFSDDSTCPTCRRQMQPNFTGMSCPHCMRVAVF